MFCIMYLDKGKFYVVLNVLAFFLEQKINQRHISRIPSDNI